MALSTDRKPWKDVYKRQAVRLTEEEHQRLTMYAQKNSLKMSDVLKNGLYEVLNKPVNK